MSEKLTLRDNATMRWLALLLLAVFSAISLSGQVLHEGDLLFCCTDEPNAITDVAVSAFREAGLEVREFNLYQGTHTPGSINICGIVQRPGNRIVERPYQHDG